MNQKVVLEILNFFLDEKHMLPKNPPLNIEFLLEMCIETRYIMPTCLFSNLNIKETGHSRL